MKKLQSLSAIFQNTENPIYKHKSISNFVSPSMCSLFIVEVTVRTIVLQLGKELGIKKIMEQAEKNLYLH